MCNFFSTYTGFEQLIKYYIREISSSTKIEMDDIDKKILNILQNNDKISYQNIANKLNMAASTVHNRVKKMINDGIIRSFNAIIDLEKVGYKTIAWIGLKVNTLKIKKIAEKLALYDEIQIVATSMGDHEIVIQIIAENEKELWRFINEKIKTIEGVKPQMDVSGFIDIYKMAHSIFF